jgi:hypothetical protein
MQQDRQVEQLRDIPARRDTGVQVPDQRGQRSADLAAGRNGSARPPSP